MSLQATEYRRRCTPRTVFPLVSLFACLLLMCGSALAAEKTVRVGAFDYYPAIYQDASGRVVGFFADLLNEIGREEGWNVEYVYGSWAEGLARLRAGEVDVLTSVAFTEERTVFMDYCKEPLLTVWGEVYGNPSAGIRNVFDLRGKRIAVMQGDFNAVVFKKHMQSFEIPCSYLELPNFDAVFKAVQDGQAQGGIVNSTVGASSSQEYAVRGTDIVFNPFPIYFAADKGKNPDVLKTLDHYLAQWRTDRDSIYHRGMKTWLRRNVGMERVIPPALWWTLAVVLFLLLAVFLFNAILRQRVKMATEKLRTSQQRYRTLFARSNDAIFFVDRCTGCYLEANSAAERLTGRTAEELRALTTGEVCPGGAQERLEMLEKNWTNQDFGEVVYRRPDGTERIAVLEVIPLDERVLFGIARDITVRKQAEEEQARLEAQLRQAQKMEAVGQLAGGVAHDFNNLLQVILGYGDLALEDLTKDNPTRAAVEEMLKAGHRARLLVSQLLAYSRRQVLDMEDIHLNEIIADLLKMLRRVIGEHIEIMVAPSEDLGVVRADRGQLGQILMNLCLNARDAMPTGGSITITTERAVFDAAYCREHDWAHSGRYVALRVSDTGCGMDEETMTKIFDPFFTTKGVGQGTGLGLAMVYGLVKQHRGMIHVASTPGAGTTFDIYLPELDAEGGVTALVSHDGESDFRGTETILIAEDDDMIRKLTCTVLERAGYTVIAAADGEEAAQLFEQYRDAVNLAVLDVVMPKMSGRAVLELMRQQRPNLRALFVSGYNMDAIHTDFVLDEGLQLLQKPYPSELLLRRVRELLN